jgi:hypothetical protein
MQLEIKIRLCFPELPIISSGFEYGLPVMDLQISLDTR